MLLLPESRGTVDLILYTCERCELSAALSYRCSQMKVAKSKINLYRTELTVYTTALSFSILIGRKASFRY